MHNRKRLTHVLIAGTLTALLLTVFLAFKKENTAVAEPNNNEQTSVVEMTSKTDADLTLLQTQIENLLAQNAAFQAQNDELRTAVATLQERENEYQVQIETANQTINELSAQTNSMAIGNEGMGAFQPHRHEHNH